jgi:hypothetical protein
MTRPWYISPYTGLFSRSGPVPPRPHDPAVFAWSGTLPRWGPGGTDLAAGGAGWDPAAAEAAAVGEAVERGQCRPLPQDEVVEATPAAWPRDEPAVGPGRWVLFHPEQYARKGFPFRPLTPATPCGWVCCREARSGEPWWVPECLVFLLPRPGTAWDLGPTVSTGLSCGRAGQPVLLRGLQEVIERDALVGAWWGVYALEEERYPPCPSLHPLPLPVPVPLPPRSFTATRRGSPVTGRRVTADRRDRALLQGIDPGSAGRRLADTTVMLTSFGTAAAPALRALLEALQVRVAEAGSYGVVVTDDYLRQGLQDYNRQALAAGRPWLLVRPNGCQVWIGPLFRPGKTGCWECLATRLRANRQIETYLQDRQGWAEPAPGELTGCRDRVST